MTITERIAYIKGLAEGMGIDSSNPANRIISELIDVVGELLMASVIYPIAYAPETEKKKKYETSF